MRFDFSEEQRMLAESVRRALGSLGPLSLATGGGTEDVTPDAASAGAALAGIGLFGLLVPEEQGGLGLGMVEAVAAAIETGRAAVPFPAIETIAALRIAAMSRADIVEAALSGETMVTAPIHGRLQAGEGSRPTVTGTLSVPFAGKARYFAAPVEGAGGPRTLLAELNGAPSTPTDGIDLTYPLARVEFSREISQNELVAARIDDVLGLLAAAEIVGAADHCLSRTVGYLKERKQFDKVIGSFQSLKHIAADCQVALEAMKASVEYAAAMHDRAAAGDSGELASEAETALRVAMAYCSEMGPKIAEQCIQMHGGIAFTWEYGLHLHFRRITRLASAHGTAYDQREILAGIAIAGAAAPGGLAAEPR